jgi:hypothetical protein
MLDMLRNSSEINISGKEKILAAYEKLFTEGDKNVRRFEHSQLRYIKLSEGVILVEQNPAKQSNWARLARTGHRIAWVMRDGKYIARIVDGEFEILN